MDKINQLVKTEVIKLNQNLGGDAVSMTEVIKNTQTDVRYQPIRNHQNLGAPASWTPAPKDIRASVCDLNIHISGVHTTSSGAGINRNRKQFPKLLRIKSGDGNRKCRPFKCRFESKPAQETKPASQDGDYLIQFVTAGTKPADDEGFAMVVAKPAVTEPAESRAFGPEAC